MICSAPARRVLIGGALRRYRETVGYSLHDAAKVLECDVSKVSRIETGQRGIRPKEARELLTEYGVPEAEQAELLRFVRRGAERGWWGSYADALPESLVDYLIMEAAATEILSYEPHLVPDLMQTEGYAVAVAESGGKAGDHLKAEVAVKSERQATVLGGGTRLRVVLGEAALYQRVGGPDVLTAQLARLAELASDYPALTVQVLPFSAGAHAVSGIGPLTIVRFGDALSMGAVRGMGAVRVPDLSGGHCLTEPAEVSCHIRAFIALQADALTPGRSWQLIQDTACGSTSAAETRNAS
jgi:transcriptional regulator with XRE-family HTH domain